MLLDSCAQEHMRNNHGILAFLAMGDVRIEHSARLQSMRGKGKVGCSVGQGGVGKCEEGGTGHSGG